MWRRALVSGVVFAGRGLRLATRLLNEVPIVLQDAALERLGSDRHYTARPFYRQREHQSQGLHAFEERALRGHFPPPPARVFVPGSGGGRELLALAERGYHVAGLEPNAGNAAAAQEELARRGFDVPVDGRTLQEWVAAPTGRFDAVLTGWGLWVHVLQHAERVAALRAFRAVCDGPVLLSFWRDRPAYATAEAPDPAQPLHPPPADRLTSWTRGVLRTRVLQRPPVERGTVWRGFYAHLASEPEVHEEAALAGYRVAWFETDLGRYPNAVLVPVR